MKVWFLGLLFVSFLLNSTVAYSACTLPGDTNGDGVVSLAEVQAVINAYLGIYVCQNHAPVANATSSISSTDTGVGVTLNGSLSSDVDGDSLTYSWTLTSAPAGSTAVLQNPTSATPTLTPDLAGTYTARLVVSDGKTSSNAATVTVSAKAVTLVQGIINSDTTWTLDKSPYKMTSTVQIAYGATLTIEPGVTVEGVGHSLGVFGTLKAIGTSQARVTFDNVLIDTGGGASQPFLMDIEFATVKGGNLYRATPSGPPYGSLILRDSILTDLSEVAYLWYPTADCFIERNMFIRSAGFVVLTYPGSVYFTNNVFYANTTPAIEEEASGNLAKTVAKFNSFLRTDRIAVKLPSGYTSAALTATENYWGTVDSAVIASMIYDRHVDLGSSSYVDYQPVLSAPDPNTPDIFAYFNQVNSSF